MKNLEAVRFRYEKQVERVKNMLGEFLQPWVLYCLTDEEVYEAAYLFMSRTKAFKKLERRMVEWELLETRKG